MSQVVFKQQLLIVENNVYATYKFGRGYTTKL